MQQENSILDENLNLPSHSFPLTSPQENSKKVEFFSKPSQMRASVDSQFSTATDSPRTSPHSQNSIKFGELTDIGASANDTDARFPNLVHNKFGKLKIRFRESEEKSKDSDLFIESPVAEEQEELEGEHHFFKKVPLFEDAEEFNTKKTHINKPRSRDEFFSSKSVDASYLPLGSVEEDNNEEELNAFKLRKKLEDINVADLNEFNQNDKTPSHERRRRKWSLQISTHDSILEEKEDPVIPHLNYTYGSQGSLHNSPGTNKLKVDELDFLEKKNKARDEEDDSDIDPIIEEAEERIRQIVDENKEYQAAKLKMNEEREFVKKVLKGEMKNENDAVLSKMGSEREYAYIGGGSSIIEEIIEEEKNGN